MFTKDTYARRNASQKRKTQNIFISHSICFKPIAVKERAQDRAPKRRVKKIEIKIKCHV